MKREITVTCAGKTYHVPEAWLMGYVYTLEKDGMEHVEAITAAVNWWIKQTMLGKTKRILEL